MMAMFMWDMAITLAVSLYSFIYLCVILLELYDIKSFFRSYIYMHFEIICIRCICFFIFSRITYRQKWLNGYLMTLFCSCFCFFCCFCLGIIVCWLWLLITREWLHLHIDLRWLWNINKKSYLASCMVPSVSSSSDRKCPNPYRLWPQYLGNHAAYALGDYRTLTGSHTVPGKSLDAIDVLLWWPEVPEIAFGIYWLRYLAKKLYLVG